MGLTVGSIGRAGCRHDRIGTAGPGKPRGFGEASEFNGHLPGTFNLKYRFGQIGILNKGLVSRIVKNQGLVLCGKIHPGLKLRFSDGGPGRVVGKTQVNQINVFFRQIRDKAVFPVAFQIGDAFVTPVTKRSGAAGHHIGVQIDRINRIGNGDMAIG